MRASEALLDPIGAATGRVRWRLKGRESIALRLGKVVKTKIWTKMQLEVRSRKPEFGSRTAVSQVFRESTRGVTLSVWLGVGGESG